MKIYDGRQSFYQWDLNQKLTSDTLQVGDEVHYSNLKQTKALITIAYELDGKVVSDVPNILLQNAHPINVDRYIKTGDSEYTIEQYSFKVKQKSKPNDYVYTETEVKSWEKLNKELSEEVEGWRELRVELEKPIPTERIEDGAINIDKVSFDFVKDLLRFISNDDIKFINTQLKPSKLLNINASLANKVTKINDESTDVQIPTAKAVYDIVDAFKAEIQGDLDEVSALVGGVE